MQKRGKTAAGTQRWLCIYCKQSHSLGHDKQKQGRLLDSFVLWLLGRRSQSELAMPDRTWRSKTSWCWQVVPKLTPIDEIYPIILVDGIRIGAFVCLIARTPEHVISWCWVFWESSNTWSILLQKIPPPTVVVCDGQKGVLLAIWRLWPKSTIQRCLFHIWQNIRSKLTLHPKTEAGQKLLRLTRDLWQVKTIEQALSWQKQLENWQIEYENFIKARTYNTNPQSGQQKWWYTHKGVRSASRQLAKLLCDNQLFTYIDKTLTVETIPRTTNHVEGGINSQIRDKLKAHRGLSQTHRQRLVDWYLYSRTKDQKPPRNCL